MPVTISPISIEEVGKPQGKEPSERTLRTRSIEGDARNIIEAIEHTGAAEVDYSDESRPEYYLSGLRAALDRMNRSDILIQKRRNAFHLVAWEQRPEDQERIAKRREIGQRLGALAHQRHQPQPHPTPLQTRRPRNTSRTRSRRSS